MSWRALLVVLALFWAYGFSQAEWWWALTVCGVATVTVVGLRLWIEWGERRA